jgi:hypothetical protein
MYSVASSHPLVASLIGEGSGAGLDRNEHRKAQLNCLLGRIGEGHVCFGTFVTISGQLPRLLIDSDPL